MIQPSRISAPRFRDVSIILTILLGVALIVSAGVSRSTLAAPSAHDQSGAVLAQNVDWMSPEMASRLDIGMDVLVPSWVPAPFTGIEPSVSASGGYYQLYWMVGGGSPTFLYIEGVAGGALPAGSPADLNKPLSINASVQGWEAIHDIGIPAGSETPIYDQVWWIANGVLYTVSSNNMTGSDSLSVANSLVVLQPPAAPAPPPVVEEPVEEPVVDTPSEPVGETWEEPGSTVQEPPVNDPAPVADEPRSVDTGTVNEPTTGASGVASTSGNADDPDPVAAPTTAGPWTPLRGAPNVPSDGTNGPIPPVIGGDGTGGWYDNALPGTDSRP